MPLNVILGKSNTGKSEYIFNKIMACENEKKQAILFVPPSGRIMAEEEYLKYTKKDVLIDTLVTSFERFVNRRVDKVELYKDKTYLKDLAKKMMVKRVISENTDMFKVFAKVKDTIGFTDKMASYIEKFSDLEDIENLEKYNEQDFLKTKLDEFKTIYTKIEDELKQKFVDAKDEMKAYIDMLNKSENNILNANIFIDNYNNFSNMEYDFIQALLLNGNEVNITLDIDKAKHLNREIEIYNTSYDTLTRLKGMCATVGCNMEVINLEKVKSNRKEDIAFLANNIFTISSEVYSKVCNNIQLKLLPNTYEEIKYIAGDILKNIKEGYEYKDIAIYTNNILMYNIYMKKIFGLYNIPIYINAQDTITNNRLVVYITTLLKLAIEGFNKTNIPILNLLKTGILDISEEQIYLFENYILEFGLRGYSIENEFTLNNNYDLELLNDARNKILICVNNLRKNLSNKQTPKEITEVIYNHFIEDGIVKKYEEELVKIREIDVNEYNKNKQVLSKLYEVMDNISLAYDKIQLKEYLELLEYGIKESTIDTIPAKVNEIEIIDINKSRGNEKKIAYIIGCYDGGLPATQIEDNIFTDIELEKLKSAGIDLKQTSEERNNMQLFNIYQTLNKVREKLIFTVPSSLMSGSSLRASSIIQEIKTILNIQLETQEINESLSIDETFMNFISKLSEIDENITKEQSQELYEKYNVYSSIERYKQIMDYSRQDKNLEKNTLDKLYNKKINSSVSRLEQFKRCPFAYYTKYILHLNKRREYMMSNLDTGSFMHEVIEKFSKHIVAKNINWQDIILDEKKSIYCKKKIDEIVDEIFEEDYKKYLTSSKYVVLKSKMKQAMRKTIFAIADSFNHSEFRPLGYEIEFENGALFAPIEVELDDGRKMLLRGKIDRIDSLEVEDNTYLRIVDYKSSEKNLKLSDIKSGISLQLMTYMCAMLENKEKLNSQNIIPASLSYFTISNKLLSIPNYEKDESKIEEKLRKALKLRGIYIRDVEILKKLDNRVEDSKQSYLEVSKRTMNNDEKVLDEDVFINECKNVRNILKEIAKQIMQGNVKIQPNKNVKGVCDYCDYSTICRKNILN